MRSDLDKTLLSLLGGLAGVNSDNVLAMGDNYDERVVDHFTNGKFDIDTALVLDNDPKAPYETAVSDPRYSDDWVSVANAATKEEAQANHDKWVAIMTSNPPDEILDVGTAESALAKDRGVRGTDWRVKRRKRKQ